MERHDLKPDSAFFNEIVRVLAGTGRRPQNLGSQISALRQVRPIPSRPATSQSSQLGGFLPPSSLSLVLFLSFPPTLSSSSSSPLSIYLSIYVHSIYTQQSPGTSGGAMASCSTSLLVVFNTAIHACAAGGDWRLALELLEELKADGLPPNYYSYQVSQEV